LNPSSRNAIIENHSKEGGIMCYLRILAAIPGFFLSSWFLMLLWGVIAPKLGIPTISYVNAMLVNITLWLAVAPLAAAGIKK
jgi:hypothetical protein